MLPQGSAPPSVTLFVVRPALPRVSAPHWRPAMSFFSNPTSSPLSLLPIGRAHSSLLLTAVPSITLSPCPIGRHERGVAILASYWRSHEAGSALIGRSSAYSRPLREGLAEPLLALWGPRREGPEVPEGGGEA